MHTFTFYCKVTHDGGTNTNPGIYSFISKHGAQPGKFRIIGYSIKVWRQGPMGGVKIFKDRTYGLHRYVTNNEEEMKEFFWIKLQAQPL
jgi:hypothetical protein